jgi:aminomethyltransferase
MGEIHFRGPRAAEAVQRLVTNNIGGMVDGRALYAVACHPDGGIVDDLIVYRVASDHFFIVVNASNIDKDYQHFISNVGAICQISNESDATGLIAFQGPKAEAALCGLTDANLAALRSFAFLPNQKVAGLSAWIARTGYTGEDGFEIYAASSHAARIWNEVMQAGAEFGIKPCGLGARNTLRLEAGMALYGHEIDASISPLEAGLEWIVKFDKGEFVGRDTLLRQKEKGLTRKLAGFEMRGRGIGRDGYEVLVNDSPAGWVTSGSPSPTLNRNIGFCYLPAEQAQPGKAIRIMIRSQPVDAVTVETPFYKRAK